MEKLKIESFKMVSSLFDLKRELTEYDAIKRMLDDTILKDNYFVHTRFKKLCNRKPFEFPEFENEKHYFADFAVKILDVFEAFIWEYTLFEIEITYKEKGFVREQKIYLENNKIYLDDYLRDEGYFCPHCTMDVDMEQIVKGYECPVCKNEASECIETEIMIFDKTLPSERTKVWYRCKNAERKAIRPMDGVVALERIESLIWKVIEENPDKVIHCPICGKDYRIRDMEGTIYRNEYSLIKEYSFPDP